MALSDTSTQLTPPASFSISPVYDGFDIRDSYRVTTFPQIFILEANGQLNWTTDAGIGPETGYLIKTQLEGLLK